MRKSILGSSAALAALMLASMRSGTVIADPVVKAAPAARPAVRKRRSTINPFASADTVNVSSAPNGGKGGKHRTNRQHQRVALKIRNRARAR